MTQRRSTTSRSFLLHLASGLALASLVGCSASSAGGGGADASTACKAGEFRCTGDVLEACKADGSDFSKVTTCKPGLCDAAGGQCDTCKPGVGTCVGADSIKACSADGQTESTAKCAADRPICTGAAGAAKCVGCAKAGDCPLSKSECAVSACSADGTCGFAPVAKDTPCTGGKCDGAGNCNVCVPGSKVCNGANGYLSCNASGKYDAPVTCASDKPYCDATSVTCVQCTAATQCPPTTNPCLSATCTANTCGFAPKAAGSACPGGTCDGAGVCNACTPGSKVCNGASGYLTCNSSGKYDPAVTCAAATPYCDSTTVTCVQCTSPTQCTAPLNPCLTATCTGGACGIGNRPDGTACSTGTESGTCSAGACKVCTDGSKRCKPGTTTTTQTCTGGAWVDGVTCSGATPTCSAGACTTSCAALSLGSRGSYAEIADTTALRLATTSFTIEMWALATDFAATCNNVLAAKRGSGTTDGWFLSVQGSGCGGTEGQLFWNEAGGGGPSVTAMSGTPKGTWFHVAVTYNKASGLANIWLNGAKIGSGSMPSPSSTTTSVLRIGEDTAGSSYGWLGKIDDLRISNVERYTSTFTPAATMTADPNTIGLWRFDEGSGTTASDMSGAGQTATLKSGATWTSLPSCLR